MSKIQEDSLPPGWECVDDPAIPGEKIAFIDLGAGHFFMNLMNADKGSYLWSLRRRGETELEPLLETLDPHKVMNDVYEVQLEISEERRGRGQQNRPTN